MYRNSLVPATDEEVDLAKTYVEERVNAGGSTNMNEALLQAADILDQDSTGDESDYVQTIVFLTDGAPTSGVTNKQKIRENLRDANYLGEEKCCKSSVFTIAFSKSPDIQFLRQLTDDHLGSLRVIRESLGSAIGNELVDLYTEIHNPYYKNVQFSFYADGEELPEDDITQSHFLQYDCGEEIVVGGHAKPGSMLVPRVEAEGADKNMVFETIPALASRASDMLSRLVAYKKVKEYLKISRTSSNETRAILYRQKALEISLKMEFVTPLTSLIVALFPPKKESPPPAIKSSFPVTRGGGRGGHFSFTKPGDYGDYLGSPEEEEEPIFPLNQAYTLYAAKLIVHVLFVMTQIL